MPLTTQLSILADRQYKAAACTAMDTILQCFCKQITILHAACKQHIITEKQLLDAQKKIQAEAASILYTHPADDPEKILFKLRTAAECLDQQTSKLSVENCVSLLCC
ncbi:MAG TPA: hypothetical protein PLS00_00205 [Niabella sp.]|nr:hypothetical protein [Niabella sp.]